MKTVKKKRNFSNGKIYCIRNNTDDDIYIGSTTQKLSKRFQNHKDVMNGYKRNRKIYTKREFGKENFYIELIEEYPCENIEQLNKREGELIRELKPVLNTQAAGRTIKEWREDNKEYLREDKKLYHIENNEKSNERCRKWYEEKKDKVKEYTSKVIQCPCGANFTQGHKLRHLKSKHHQRYEQSLQED